MGSPEFAVPSLERLVTRYELVAVYTQPDRPAGRGREVAVSPVKQAAVKLGLPVVQPEKLRSPEAVAQLRAISPDVIVVSAFGQILPEAVLEIPRYGCINIHPSVLPRHRGASPVAAAILAGDDITGVSIMKMDKGLDTGPVLVQSRLPVTGDDTTGSLTDKLSLMAAEMIGDVVAGWVNGELTPQPQKDTEATYSGTINKEDGEINWQRPAAETWHKVRAFQPWPGAFTRWQGKRLEIIQGIPLASSGKSVPGEVIDLKKSSGNAAFGISTGDGILGVCAVQLEGKRKATAGDFLRGQRNFIGSRLPS